MVCIFHVELHSESQDTVNQLRQDEKTKARTKKTNERLFSEKKTMSFTAEQLLSLFETGILDPTNHLHLEAMVGSILGLYGLLRSCETMTIQVGDVLNGLDATLPGKSFDVEYPYATKNQEEVFSFKIPAKYRCFFQAYRLQLSTGCDKTSRFLKNQNSRSKTRVHILGIKKFADGQTCLRSC